MTQPKPLTAWYVSPAPPLDEGTTVEIPDLTAGPEPLLSPLQALVGGWLTLVRLDSPLGRVEAWIDEDGQAKRLPENPVATRIFQACGHPAGSMPGWPGVVGPVVFLAPNLQTLAPSEIEMLAELARTGPNPKENHEAHSG